MSIKAEDSFLSLDPDAVVVPFTDRIYYPGAMFTDQANSTHHSERVSVNFSNVSGGPEASPPRASTVAKY